MQCKRCGYCCTFRVRLSFFEYIKLLFLGYRKFTLKDNSGKRCLKQKENKDCFFLKRNGDKASCRIYSHRPKVCRYYAENSPKDCAVINPDVKENII
ncbi:hypothetical protein GF336_00020 [Candidatus Woesearchaeota archaeon]|nr:hypothetical protein [Candidatus Woesearchaeota archaeon]